jgi:D-glutamate cyclase
MTLDERLRTIRDAIQIDVGNRGLARDPAHNLLTACPNDLADACRSIANHAAPRVGIVTGFMIPTVDPPTGETDGPPGALFLAQALTRLGIPCVLLSDGSGYDALWAGLELLELSQAVTLVDLPMDLDPAGVFHSTRPVTHLIAIERSGPSYEFDAIPPEHRARNHTMRGRDLTDLTAPAHLLFEGPRGYVTIGIGDGGNEIGMGRVPYPIICKNIPNGELTACRTATDHLIVAGVSNWGAWAIAAGVMLMKGSVDVSLFQADRELKLLKHLVERGPLVDGKLGEKAASVDGLTFDEYVKPLLQIGDLVRS